MAQLGEFSYLDAVIHETLRVYPPITLLVKTATESGIVPTGETWTDAHGVQQSSVRYELHLCGACIFLTTHRIAAGDTVALPIMAMHRSKDIWGEDADEFRPERWLGGAPAGAATLTGVWANSLTFSGGPRGCIGYLFSVVE